MTGDHVEIVPSVPRSILATMCSVHKDIMLPELRNGDWLMFPNAGAYTVAGACDFNGINMTRPKTFYVYSDSPVDSDKL